MRIHRLLPVALALGLLSAATTVPAQPTANAGGQAEQPRIEDLGNGRYRIGAIVVEKDHARFTVPGVVLRDAPPLEFVAVSKGGHKAYESLLELEANAYEFNVACILIGLKTDGAVAPEVHFDERPVQGDAVGVAISWEDGDGARTFEADKALVDGDKPPPSDRWIYTGSRFSPEGFYQADQMGTLIGFVHDLDSVIHHREGIGLQNYGGVTVDRALLPPVGTPVRLIVTREPTER